jgi:hypothetical protein
VTNASSGVECRACAAGLPITWHVQSRKYMHLRGLEVIVCEKRDAREERAKDIANDRGNEDQRGR